MRIFRTKAYAEHTERIFPKAKFFISVWPLLVNIQQMYDTRILSLKLSLSSFQTINHILYICCNLFSIQIEYNSLNCQMFRSIKILFELNSKLRKCLCAMSLFTNFYHTPRLFLAHYCILWVILLLSAYEVNFGVNILLYRSVRVIYYWHTRSITLKNAKFQS